MQFLLRLSSQKAGVTIPINYQYPLASAIYRILEKADREYAEFLHEKGYGKGFKLFTFSDIRCPFRIHGDRLTMLQEEVEVIISFHLPKGAETFIKGLFMSQEIVIADKTSKGVFTVRSVEALPDPLGAKTDKEMVQLSVNPISPVVCGWKNERGHYDFLAPGDARFCDVLIQNWREKIKTCFDVKEAEKAILLMDVKYFKNPPKSRLITIKAETHQETKIRGWMNFELKITGEKRFVELIWNTGVGVYNSMGCGCVRE